MVLGQTRHTILYMRVSITIIVILYLPKIERCQITTLKTAADKTFCSGFAAYSLADRNTIAFLLKDSFLNRKLPDAKLILKIIEKSKNERTSVIVKSYAKTKS